MSQAAKEPRELSGIIKGHPCCHLHLSGDRKTLSTSTTITTEGDPKFRLLSRRQNAETLSSQKSRREKYAKHGRRLALDKRRRRKGKTWLDGKFWGKLHSYTHSLKYLFTHYLTACLLKLFYTFQCGQNGKEHSDPVEILPAQRSWNNEALKVENRELEYKT